LENQTISRENYEIIVCDSHSPDGTADCIAELKKMYSNLEIYHTINTLSAKRNLGIEKAKADIVVFLDDDVLPVNTFVEKHLNAHQLYSNTVVCGGIRYPSELTLSSNYYRYRDSQHFSRDKDGKELKFNNITVMNLSFKKHEVLTKVGLVSTDFVKYGGEDIEYGYRIMKASMRLIVCYDALVYHYEYNGTLDNYFKKIQFASRYGGPLFYELTKYQLHLSPMSLLDPLNSKSMQQKIKSIIVNLLVNKQLYALVVRYLRLTDKIGIFYNKFMFHYLKAYAYKSGVLLRYSESKSDADTKWF